MLKESMSVQNMEEASTVVSEFIYSIDNLPGEVSFLLQEIKIRDLECQTIQQQIDKDAAKYIRHTLRGSVPPTPTSGGFGTTTTTTTTNTSSTSSSSVSTPSANPNPITAPPPTGPTGPPNGVNGTPSANNNANNANSNHPTNSLPAQIASCYQRLNELSDEKCLLSQQIIDLLLKTRARLDYDLAKVKVLQGEFGNGGLNGSGSSVDFSNPFTPSTPGFAGVNGGGSFGSVASAGGGAGGGGGGYGVDGIKTAQQISESLRNALGGGSAVSTPGVAGSAAASGAASPAQTPSSSSTKRRRTGVSTSIKLTTPTSSPSSNKKRSSSPHVAVSNSTIGNMGGGTSRSRLSRQIHPPAHHAAAAAASDMDAEGEEEEEEAETEAERAEVEERGEGEPIDDDDETPYCFCRKPSYGDMIACDNETGCPYEWFHIACVGLKLPTPEKWYCSDCAPKMAGATKKGRKK